MSPEELAPFVKLGIVGILLLIIVLGLIFGIKVFPIVIAKLTNGKNGKLETTEAAGEKSTSWWILEMQRLHKEANLPVIEVLIRIEKVLVDNLKTIRDNEFLLRQIRADQRRRAGKHDSDELP